MHSSNGNIVFHIHTQLIYFIFREFKLTCHGVGVHPPLQLSHQMVHFAATAVNDVSTSLINIINSHVSMNEFSHPVPRVGKGK